MGRRECTRPARCSCSPNLLSLSVSAWQERTSVHVERVAANHPLDSGSPESRIWSAETWRSRPMPMTTNCSRRLESRRRPRGDSPSEAGMLRPRQICHFTRVGKIRIRSGRCRCRMSPVRARQVLCSGNNPSPVEVAVVPIPIPDRSPRA